MINKLKTVGICKIENGVEYYNYTYSNNVGKICSYNTGDNYITRYEWKSAYPTEISEEVKEQLLNARQQFVELLRSLLDGTGGFHCAKGEHYLIAYRKETQRDCKKESYFYDKANNLYRFIVFLGNGKVEQHLCNVESFLSIYRYILFPDIKQRNLKLFDEISAGLRKETCPLYVSAQENDRYLYCALKYIADLATQEEADEATAVDGLTRFVPENKTYHDVEVVKVCQIPVRMFMRSECYSCAVKVDGRTWQAVWYPKRSGVLHIEQYYPGFKKTNIEIADEVVEVLRSSAVKIFPSVGEQYGIRRV